MFPFAAIGHAWKFGSRYFVEVSRWWRERQVKKRDIFQWTCHYFHLLISFISCRYRTVLLSMKENILVLQKEDIDGKMTKFPYKTCIIAQCFFLVQISQHDRASCVQKQKICPWAHKKVQRMKANTCFVIFVKWFWCKSYAFWAMSKNLWT